MEVDKKCWEKEKVREGGGKEHEPGAAGEENAE